MNTTTTTAVPARTHLPDAPAPDVSAPDGQAPEALVREHAHRVRRHVAQMCANPEGGHLGGSVSMAEILATLYHAVLRVDPGDPAAPDRDVLILSKGHGALGLYAALAGRGFFPEELLSDYGNPDSPLTAHPNPAVPGVEMPTGSLGHGLALGVGTALDFRLSGADRRCFVVLGDGELQEGSVWEAAMMASALHLDQLVAVVDANGLQITGPVTAAMGEPGLAERWRGFGWAVHEVDGHDPAALRAAFCSTPDGDGRPAVVLARTVKGRGFPQVEGQARSHYARLTDRQVKRALRLLESEQRRSSGL
ncbi:transketolase [Streptomyces sp. WAC07061]|uniref:transketolase n=1 Tax=Streptomyces sp. WAC07061 TaxID=2487410 RepID=UPI000F792B14|nr:transketolase [Streptomyces sp. WAC07061]RSS52271.1 transketolase [Streptomyces sp. WAC07061]